MSTGTAERRRGADANTVVWIEEQRPRRAWRGEARRAATAPAGVIAARG